VFSYSWVLLYAGLYSSFLSEPVSTGDLSEVLFASFAEQS